MSERVVVIGAGGHAAVVVDAVRGGGEHEPVACVDDDASLHGGSVLGVPIVGSLDQLGALRDEGATSFIVGVGGADDLSVRELLFGRGTESGSKPISIVHRTAIVGESVVVAGGSFIGAGAILGPRASVGVSAIVNSGAIVEHDAKVGDHAHVAPGAMLAGGVRVGSAALVGMGATVRQGVTLGDRAIVGMGAVVTKDVTAGAVVVGCPARQR